MANDKADSSCHIRTVVLYIYYYFWQLRQYLGSEYRDIRVQKVENGPFKIVLIPTYNVCPTSDRQIVSFTFLLQRFFSSIPNS